MFASSPRIVRRSGIGVFCCVCLALAAFAGCSKSSDVQRFAALGKVTLNGRPLQNASIVFQPRSRGGVVAVAPIVDGQFQWSESNGPTAGDFDVLINPEAVDESEALEIVRQKRRQPIEMTRVPPKYQRPGGLSATVSPQGPNDFAFSLVSR